VVPYRRVGLVGTAAAAAVTGSSRRRRCSTPAPDGPRHLRFVATPTHDDADAREHQVPPGASIRYWYDARYFDTAPRSTSRRSMRRCEIPRSWVAGSPPLRCCIAITAAVTAMMSSADRCLVSARDARSTRRGHGWACVPHQRIRCFRSSTRRRCWLGSGWCCAGPSMPCVPRPALACRLHQHQSGPSGMPPIDSIRLALRDATA
jgi:hypothetical protein